MEIELGGAAMFRFLHYPMISVIGTRNLVPVEVTQTLGFPSWLKLNRSYRPFWSTKNETANNTIGQIVARLNTCDRTVGSCTQRGWQVTI